MTIAGLRRPLLIALVALLALPGPAAAAPVCADACAGDCNGDGVVAVDEVVGAVAVALGGAPLDTCLAGDRDGDLRVTVDELLRAVAMALNGCPVQGAPPPDDLARTRCRRGSTTPSSGS